MGIALGVHMVCRSCEGTGKRLKMTPEDKRIRASQLEQARRAKLPTPPLVKAFCTVCSGTGYTERPKGT